MNDEQLLQTAKNLDDEDWNRAFKLAKQAQGEETRTAIERIARIYYRNEEYRNGDN